MYSLDDINTIKYNNEDYNVSIPNTIFKLIQQLDKMIIPPVTEVTNQLKKTEQKPRQTNGYGPQKTTRPSSGVSSDDWIATKKIKPTKMDVKTGVEKDINDIRISLNKISTKNYESQKEIILLFITKMFEEETLEDAEKHLQPIAQFIFDIASANKFYSELYADLYQSLILKYTVFESILHEFVSTYKDLTQKNIYVDPAVNYDAFCDYTKKNENRRAMASFLVMLMNRGVISTQTIVDIIIHFQELFIQFVDEENRTNEVDELTELLFLFITLGKTKLQECPEWENKIHKYLLDASKQKANQHKSLSSRCIFKFQDCLKK